MERNTFYILSCGFAFFTLIFAFSSQPLTPDPRPLTSTKDYVRKNKLFLQNEPKFQKVKLNVNKVLTKDYEKMDTWLSGKNEPKTNPNEPKFKKAKMNVIKVLTKDYEKKLDWALYENEPNSNPKQTQFHMILAYFSSRAKKCCSPPLCCGISKEKMIFCNLINRKYQID